MIQDVPRFPIGPFAFDAEITPAQRIDAIAAIAAVPDHLAAAIEGLTETQLDTTYRKGSWTLRQVVHHVADSHINAYVRFKLALTEDVPTIKPYLEAPWAELIDARTLPVDVSLHLLDALHHRWVTLLHAMDDAAFTRMFSHPEHQRQVSLHLATALYGWHGRHHTAVITACREQQGWMR